MWLPIGSLNLGEAQPRYCFRIEDNLSLRFQVPQLQVSIMLLKAGALVAIQLRYHPPPICWAASNAQTARSNYFYSWVIQEAAGVVPGLDLHEFCKRSTLRSLSDTAVCVYVRSAPQTQW